MDAQSSRPRDREEEGIEPIVPPELVAQAQAAVDSGGADGKDRSESEDISQAKIEQPPPPLYSKLYGEIDLHQNGLNTVARVGDDGRLDINITEDSRVVTNVLASALRKQLNVQQKRPPPTPASQTTQGGAEQAGRPPALNIVIHVVGSRGDVQPFVALGKELQAVYGHRIRLATHPNFRDFVTENGLEFFSIGGDPAELMAFMVKNPGLMPGKDALRKGEIGKRRKGMYEIVQGCWRSCFEAGDGTGIPVSDAQAREDFDAKHKPFIADAIIANPPSFAHVHCAEKMGIPLHLMFTMPWSPTQSFPHPLANIQESSTDVSVTNFLSYALVELMTWQGLGDVVNRFREKALGLEPLSLIWAPGMLNRLRIPYTYCWSPSLIPKPRDWGSHISVSGFYFLSLATNYEPSAELSRFLASGPPPIYIGFGSIVVDDANAMTELIFDAVRKSGQRALVSKGWGGLGAGSLDVPEDIFMLGNVPHDWLFRHVSCVVHHGGAGTTAAGIALGKPTIVVPFFGDQPFWGAMVAKAGAGPEPIHNKKLDSDKLANAINFALKPSVLQKAQDLGNRIASEKGTASGAEAFHASLQPYRMRCAVCPTRAAVWVTKKDSIQLSALAATGLADAGLLNFGELQLHRSREYDTDDTPWDPIGGGASALASTIGSLMMGVADFPMELLRLFSKKTTKDETTTKHESDSPARGPPLEGRSSNGATSETVKQAGAEAKPESSDDPITMESAVGAGKSVARIVDAGLKSPMDFTLALAKGFHNAPKLYGDESVRPVEKVTGIKSGFRAASKGFGYGFYDGISGLVTQPLEGAKKDGFSGLVKGFGKGIGGVVLKPGAAIWGLPGYTFSGIYKEMRKLYGSSVQNYIIAARTAQGFDEWNSASEKEQRAVVSRWSELLDRSAKQRQRPQVQGPESGMPESSTTYTTAGARSQQGTAAANHTLSEEYEHAIRESVQQTSGGNREEDAMIERAIRASLVEIKQRPAQDDADNDAIAEAIAASLKDIGTTAENATQSNSASSNAPISGLKKDNPDVDSDEDENIKAALQLSRGNAG